MHFKKYYQESIKTALDDSGVLYSKNQLGEVIESICSSIENYGLAHGQDNIPNHLQIENEKLKKQLKIEKSAVFCTSCLGTGRIYGVSLCFKCNGIGRIYSLIP